MADRFLMLASDGVWEFLTNQSVADLVIKFTDPLAACRAVVAESYRLWLQYDNRTDDITMILAFIEHHKPRGRIDSHGGTAGATPAKPKPPPLVRMPSPEQSFTRHSNRNSSGHDGIASRDTPTNRTSSTDFNDGPGGDAGGFGVDNRPVRRGLSKEKKRQMSVNYGDDTVLNFGGAFAPLEKVPKSVIEIERIRTAVRANFLFAHLNAEQLQLVIDSMVRVSVCKGDVVIRQGDEGDNFYVVEQGEYAVTILQGGKQVEVLRYTTANGTYPSFGELALMYSKPRAATVTAATDGVLWATGRNAFRSVLMKSPAVDLLRTLRSVNAFESLSVAQLQRLQDMLTEVTFHEGEYVIRQGDTVGRGAGGTMCMYIIAEGEVRVTRNVKPNKRGKGGGGGHHPHLAHMRHLEAASNAATREATRRSERVALAAAEPPPEAKELARLGAGSYFGERALLFNEPRSANVIAASQALKCLYISKPAFEEVLGPLQDILDDDRRRREAAARERRIRQEAAGLAGEMQLSAFSKMGGTTCTSGPAGSFHYSIVRYRKQVYTLRSASHEQLQELGLSRRAADEKDLLTDSSMKDHRLVPLALAAIVDDDGIHLVFRTRIALSLATPLAELSGPDLPSPAPTYVAGGGPGFDEYTTRFYIASVLLAIEHLHSLSIAHRNLCPEVIVLDEAGQVQIADLRYAVRRVGPPPRDFCGFVHYLSPEQVSGKGHGLAVDYWALGILAYELLTGGANPWVYGDPIKDSEVAIYKRISEHSPDGISKLIPQGATLSSAALELINRLMHPDSTRRLGAQSGAGAVRSLGWFGEGPWGERMDWERLGRGEIEGPHRAQARASLHNAPSRAHRGGGLARAASPARLGRLVASHLVPQALWRSPPRKRDGEA